MTRLLLPRSRPGHAVAAVVLLAAWLMATAVVTPARAETPDRPHIVVFLADDMGYGDPGCYQADSKVPTPHMDALASDGLRFTDAHTPSAVCTPTRYGLLTGRYAWRTRLKRSVLWPFDRPLIQPDRRTLPELLATHGYRTAMFGKWHLGWDWPTTDGEPAKSKGQNVDFTEPIEQGPVDRGFDHYFGVDVPNFPPYTFIENERVTERPTASKPKGMFGHAGPMAPGWELEPILPTLGRRAADHIDRHAKQHADRPLFLYFACTAPHTPIVPTDEHRGASDAGVYGDFVHQVDATIGRIMDALKRNGMAENTLLIVTSDNGSPARAGSPTAKAGSVLEKFDHNPNAPWRGMKADIHEGGHRVPMIIRWPGAIAPGRTTGQTVCLTDLMPTFAAVAGIDRPENLAPDGFNLLPLLRGEPSDGPIRPAVVHHSGAGMFAIRSGDWKLIEGLGPGGFSGPIRKPKKGEPKGQLYNLAEDPGEQENVYAEYPDVVERLSNRLDEIRSSGRTPR